MNEEQNTRSGGEAEKDTSEISLTTGSTLQSQEEFESDKGRSQEDYYSVDDPKKGISTTIGDGEMHNEGLVGDGSSVGEDPLSASRIIDEQDAAELHDSEG